MAVCFSAAQTSCVFRSARILLHVNVINDYVAKEKKLKQIPSGCLVKGKNNLGGLLFAAPCR